MTGHGAITTTGQVRGVQKRRRVKFQKVVLVHCESHRLNLILNELNWIPCTRNTICNIKETIHFFRQSLIRQAVTSSLIKLCTTRWLESYKALRKYYEHFILTVEELEYFHINGNNEISLKVTCYLNSVTMSQFIKCLRIIAKYSATCKIYN